MFRVLQGNGYREKKTFTYRNPSVGIEKIKNRFTIRISRRLPRHAVPALCRLINSWHFIYMPEPLNKKLYEEAKKIANETYKKASAYKSGFIIKKYKELGGKYADDGKEKKLKRWFSEEWRDIGGLEYPVYRPTKRISKDTPLTASEINPIKAMEQIQLKQKIKGKKNLPPFI